MCASGSGYVTVQKRVAQNGIDTSHFTGQSWAKGLRGRSSSTKIPLSEILVENSTYTGTSTLKKRLIQEGLLEFKCAGLGCGITEWRGIPAPLELDHVNGVRTDNRIPNLRLLCPNCYAQTDTYCGKNIGRVAAMGVEPTLSTF